MKSMTSVITKSALVLAACASMNAFAGTAPSGKAPAPVAPVEESGALFDSLGATLEVGYDTRYYFRVRAFNAGGNSGYSNIANIRTKR